MRFSYRLLATLCTAALLNGCGWPETSGKTPTSSGREDVLLKVAHVTESGGGFAAAERMYQQAVASSPRSMEARIELAEFYKRHNQNPQAVATLNDALKVQPKNADVMRELANTYINAGSPEKALATLNDAIAIDNKNALLFSSKGVALDMLGNYADAQSSYQTALLLAPEDAMTIKTNLSMSYILSGSYDEAIHLLLPLLRSPEVTANVRQNLALAYGLKGDSANARSLGLKDLTPKEMEESLKFYRMVSSSNGSNKKAIAAVPVSVNDIFPTEAPAGQPVHAKPEIKNEHSASVVMATPEVLRDEEDNDYDRADINPEPVAQPSPQALAAMAPATGKPAVPIPASATPVPQPYTYINQLSLPEPVLKPDRIP